MEEMTRKANEQMKQLNLATANNKANNQKPGHNHRTVSRSSSRDSRCSSVDSSLVNPTGKKVPMNKIQVGQAPSPSIKNAQSKIGSLSNASYKPKGGDIKIESKKLNWNAESKIGSLSNKTYTPGGGDKRIETKKQNFSHVTSRVGSLSNVKHQPGGGAKKIFDDKDYIKDAKSKSPCTSGKTSPSHP